MNNIVESFFRRWMQPVLFWAFSCLLYGLSVSGVWNNSSFRTAAFILFAMGAFVMLLATFYQLATKNWWIGFLNAILFGITVFVFLSVIFMRV